MASSDATPLVWSTMQSASLPVSSISMTIDVSPLARARTGIGNYLRGRLAGLAEAGSNEHELVAFGPSGPRGRGRIREALAGLPVDLRLPLLPHVARTAWSRAGRLAIERVVGALDVFHFSDWMYPPQRGGVRATTVHDLVPLRFPEWVQPETLRMHGRKYEHAAQTCDRVFVNSRFTAGEVVELLGVPEERVVVAYPGIDPRFHAEGVSADLGGPYVLTVSTLEPRKNLPALVEAFTLLRQRRPELTLPRNHRALSRAGSTPHLPPQYEVRSNEARDLRAKSS